VGFDLVAFLTAIAPFAQALEPAAVALFNVIKDAVEGKYKSHEEAVAAAQQAVNDAVARVSELAGDVAQNNATVDAELAKPQP
jgi:hypothetical protein